MFRKADRVRIETLETENRRLKRAVEELSILNDLGREIGASLDAGKVMSRIVRRSVEAVHAEQGVISLVNETTDEGARTLIRTTSSSGEHPAFHLNQQLLGWMHLHKKPLLITDPRTDDRFRGVKWDAEIRSALCVPLLVRSRLIGILTLYNKKGGDEFSDGDRRLLAIIAAQSAQVIENARLYEEEQALVRMQEEVRLAFEIQTSLLPSQPPVIEGYELAGTSIPAQTVGGDCFDYIPLEGEKFALCVGDVSGKGLPASLLMANVQATLRSQALMGLAAAQCMARTNRLLSESVRNGTFVTLFYAVLDPVRHRLTYANAGHNRPYICRSDGTVETLGKGGLVLGVLPDFTYSEVEVALNPGDQLLIYSDGIPEAMNERRDQFGDSRLADVFRQKRSSPPREIIDAVLAAARGHMGGSPQNDDMTLMVVRRT